MLTKVNLLLLIFRVSAWSPEIESECEDTLEEPLPKTAIPLSFNNGSAQCFNFQNAKGQVKLTNWSWSSGQSKHPLDVHNSLQFFYSNKQLIAQVPVSQLPQQVTFDLLPNKQIYVYGNVTSGYLITYISDVSQPQPATETNMIYSPDGTANPVYITYPEDDYLLGFHLHYVLAGSSVCIESISLPSRINCTTSYMRLIVANASIDRHLCKPVAQTDNPKTECINYWEFSFSTIRIEFYTKDISGFTSKYAGVRVKVDGTLITTTTTTTTTTRTTTNSASPSQQECPHGAGSEYSTDNIPIVMTAHTTCPKYSSLNEVASHCVLNCRLCAKDFCSDRGSCIYDNTKPEMKCRCPAGCMDGPNCTLSVGCIAYIAIGCIIGWVLLLLCLFFITHCIKKRRSAIIKPTTNNANAFRPIPLPRATAPPATLQPL